jgi:hypothetical protein
MMFVPTRRITIGSVVTTWLLAVLLGAILSSTVWAIFRLLGVDDER